ncbi:MULTISPECIES: hypothetical protein [Vibrio]|uniref:Uncharacterized protein n=1 Tax=Vibrio lentus TaxID=136468 RepID=A0A4U2FCH2_9VIBR|nr:MULTISPECIES: hypothetical protein [Vibrio]CAH6835243.1 conserved membrane hypothetical protein [Vibrio chagasii]TKG13169.1 hypothetical protein FCV91_00585 [Vibrio lentus]CAH6858089.1 conserved membrane hypothetical protein [Vibrio chagasii]CAH7132539.1 conserved membrane hypothetical protein [Vibrio chagasii]CAH7154971.1 conserved membrane hypothetical protein [Vibrio chagasii]
MPRPTSLLLILAVCLLGYWLLSNHPKQRYPLRRGSGYHTFFASGGTGLGLFILSTLAYISFGYELNWLVKLGNEYLDSTLNDGPPTQYIAVFSFILEFISGSISLGSYVLKTVFQSEASRTSIALFDIVAICGPLTFIIIRIATGNSEKRKQYFLKAFSEDSESTEFTKLFFHSYQKGEPILFTMSDNKIYIGYPTEIHAESFNDIRVLPLYSGYRTPKKRKLRLVTPYKDVIEEFVKKDGNGARNFEKKLTSDHETYMIYLPIREILYAHPYSFETARKAEEAEKELKSNSYSGKKVVKDKSKSPKWKKKLAEYLLKK